MPKFKIIANPVAGKGHAARIIPTLCATLRDVNVKYDLVETTAAGQTVSLAHQAMDDGFDTLIAVGGDGTAHEIVNAIMEHNSSQPVTLGLIPAGSGNDLAAHLGIPQDTEQACRILVAGKTKQIDIGHAVIDGQLQRYFDNTFGIGFDGLVTMETKRLARLRGIPLYLLAVLRTVFVRLKPTHCVITSDAGQIDQSILLAVIANGPREGGGFRVAPQACCDDGLLDLIVAATLPVFEVMRLIPRFLNGTHLGHPAVQMHHVHQVSITSPDPLYLHIDGELPCSVAHEVQVQILPAALRIIVP